MITSIIRFLNIILVALLAGTSFGIWIGLNPINYSASTYIEQQRHLVVSLQTLLVSLVIIAISLQLLPLFFSGRTKKFSLLGYLQHYFFWPVYS
jgi:uncharacterized membrane protein YedE/YeeE